MAREKVELTEHIRNLSMVGAAEIISKLPTIHRQYKDITRNVMSRKPDLAILIDYPGFNLKVAGYLRRKSIPVIYYIIPQVWAWGAWRIKKIKKYVSKALVLFPFEEKLLRDQGMDCDFVGHPITDSFGRPPSREKKERTTIALLPGSRRHEINFMLPVMLESAEIIKKELGEVDFLLAESGNIEKELYDSYLDRHGEVAVTRLRNDTSRVLAECDIAMITSGTATLEAAMMEKPMVIVYKASGITYMFYLLLSRVPFLGLANIIAGKEIVPELLQKEMKADNLASKVIEIAQDPAKTREITEELRKVRLALGGKGAARRAAEAVKRFCDRTIKPL